MLKIRKSVSYGKLALLSVSAVLTGVFMAAGVSHMSAQRQDIQGAGSVTEQSPYASESFASEAGADGQSHAKDTSRSSEPGSNGISREASAASSHTPLAEASPIGSAQNTSASHAAKPVASVTAGLATTVSAPKPTASEASQPAALPRSQPAAQSAQQPAPSEKPAATKSAGETPAQPSQTEAKPAPAPVSCGGLSVLGMCLALPLL